MRASGSVPATEFKARCLELMDRVAEGRETYVITKRGKPVAKLVPADPPEEKSLFGCMADLTAFVGDLDPPPPSDEEGKKLERQRAEQGKAWDREWRRHGTVAGKKTVGPPPDRTRARSGARTKGGQPKR